MVFNLGLYSIQLASLGM